MVNFSSKLIENAVLEISKIPGVGKKSALRMTLFLLKQNPSYAQNLSTAIRRLREEIVYCKSCYNVSDNIAGNILCNICLDEDRDNSILCIVENIQDVIAIENTGKYNGLYHVLGGNISPIDGIGPQDLNLDSLFERVFKSNMTEIIFALSSTIEGDTTAFYIKKKLMDTDIKISIISRGISFGGEIEYVDEITLGNSIASRVLYDK